jgi:hypothetical protein
VLLLLGILIVSVTREFWMLRIGQSLMCAEEMRPSDVLPVQNFPASETKSEGEALAF